MNAALLVNRMLGLRNLQQFQVQDDAAVRGPYETCRYRDRDGQVWRELDMSELVYSEEFLQAGL
jgi:twitching motility protein PilI